MIAILNPLSYLFTFTRAYTQRLTQIHRHIRTHTCTHPNTHSETHTHTQRHSHRNSNIYTHSYTHTNLKTIFILTISIFRELSFKNYYTFIWLNVSEISEIKTSEMHTDVLTLLASVKVDKNRQKIQCVIVVQ
jgi:hypothetical protein